MRFVRDKNDRYRKMKSYALFKSIWLLINSVINTLGIIVNIKLFNKIRNKSVWRSWSLGLIILMNPIKGQAGVENLGETIINWNTKKLAQPAVFAVPSEATYSKSLKSKNLKNKNIIYSIGIGTSERSRIIAEEEENIIKSVLSRGSSRKAFKNILWQRFLEMFTWFPKSAVEKRHQKLVEAINSLGSSVPEGITFENYLKYSKIDIPVVKGLKKNKVKLQWDYRANVSLDEVLNDIKKGGIENIIFIVHGDENGYIYDTHGNRFDDTFFKLIGPEVQSLAFYSCHGDKLVSAYQLQELDVNSMFAKRMVFTVPPSEKFNGDALSLSSGIKYFIRAVDKHLDSELESNTQNEEQLKKDYVEPAQCQLDISGFDSLKSVFTVRLNRQLIGAFHGKDPLIEFDCDLLDDQETNTIILSNPHKNQELIDDIYLGDQDITIAIWEQKNRYPLEVKYKHFGKSTNNTIYRSSKIEFEIAN